MKYLCILSNTMSTQKEEQNPPEQNPPISTEEIEEQKKITRMKIIYGALEQGWSVKKSDNDPRTFEFTKTKSLEEDYKGLVVFCKNNSSNICADIQKHLELKKKIEKKHERSVSTPVTKTS